MHIVSKRYKGTLNKGGRDVYFTLSNEHEYSKDELLGIIGIFYTTFYSRIGRCGMTDPKVLLDTNGNTVNFPPPANYFNRGEVCIKDGLCCVNYAECADKRLFSPDEWEKPESDCYVATVYKHKGIQSSMSGSCAIMGA